MPGTHAILSPSGASRWLTCTPSARLEEQFTESTSAYAEEGTLAHKLGELLIKLRLGMIDRKAFDISLQEIEQNEFYNESMYEYCDEYATYVNEQFNGANVKGEAIIFLEQQLDMTEFVPEGFGTGDVIIVSPSVLLEIDFKYGKGVPVSAVDNKQMMLYALGAIRGFDFLYDINVVQMTIYQPRIDNISTWEISVQELFDWAENVLKPKAALAFAGEGEFIAGNHCQFCRAKSVCKKLADKNLELAKYDFADPELLTDDDVADILSRASLFINWLGAVEEYALVQAVNHNKQWPGYKLVEGRSNRKYSDPDAVVQRLKDKGYDEEKIFEKKLLAITKMEKLLAKGLFNAILSDLIVKAPGKSTLVPLSDKRPEKNSTESAIKDFA